MTYDNLTDCTRCGSNACYFQEVNQDITISLCYGCGFQSNSIMIVGSDMFNEQLETLPELYKILMDEEENGKVWMPSFHNVEGKGMVFANGISRDDWYWASVLYVDGKADMKTKKEFAERDFMDALSYATLLP
ncbi:hypothetical protein PQZ39_00315 [bacterium]|nr:hypothetical protein [bacterium]